VSCIQNSLARAHRTAAAYIHVTHPPPPLRLTSTTTPPPLPPFRVIQDLYPFSRKKNHSRCPLARRRFSAVSPSSHIFHYPCTAHTYLPSPTPLSSSSLFLVSYFLLVVVVDVVVVLRSRVIDTFRTCLDTRVQRGGGHADGQFSCETLFLKRGRVRARHR